MWSPTHVQVLVKRAKGLNAKGKNGTNDALVTIALGKEKYQTSVKERAREPVEWCEQCELAIPEQGNHAKVLLSVLHRNYLGVDEFLGQVTLPLQDYDVYEKPKTRWHPLLCKPGQNKTDYRGELEVKLGFTVRASETTARGSMSELNKRTRGSLTSLNKVAGSVGGSLLSLGGKERKNIKKLAAKVGQKVERVGEKARRSVAGVKLGREREVEGRLSRLEETGAWQGGTNRDPGVNSDEEEERDDMFMFDRLSHRSSMRSELSLGKLGTVSPASTPDLAAMRRSDPVVTPATPRIPDIKWEEKLRGGQQEEEAGSLASLDSRQTLPEDYSLPSYSQAMSSKKKIIPVVQSEPESSPSPEEPSSPVDSPHLTTSNSLTARFRQTHLPADLGDKLKNSFSFRDKCSMPSSQPALESPGHGNHSLTHSDTSLGPPNGTRIVLGRETSPTPASPDQRIAAEIVAKFQHHSREDLITMVVSLQASAESQGKKLADLEDYLDGLLIRVMETAPILLQKESMMAKPGHR